MARITIFDRMADPAHPSGDIDVVLPGDAVTFRDEDFAYRTRVVARVLTSREGRVLQLEPVLLNLGATQHVVEPSMRLAVAKVLRLLRTPESAAAYAARPEPKTVAEIAAPGPGPSNPDKPYDIKPPKPPKTIIPSAQRDLATMDKAWRRLASQAKYQEAAAILLGWLDGQDVKPPIMYFHAAQMLAMSDDPAQAVKFMAASLYPNRGNADWNAWVNANMAFLQGDISRVQAEIRRAGRHGHIVRGLVEALKRGEQDYGKAIERASGCPAHAINKRVPAPDLSKVRAI